MEIEVTEDITALIVVIATDFNNLLESDPIEAWILEYVKEFLGGV